ncbi:polysaccharide deacetylase family protein [Actinospica durhamensis]|uniref:Polysaccharide deacetylase family protein n=1 Tax=Actinospica durhamensis TaxID=1508375 RepID=A0A941IPN6_9ACTN|nr:polysaccharide deacetylase family protein [Actinospica durhamensis]MBR7836745.1 polysaccharide deacetylase family protein [Actinospica durhamensis]
MTDEMWSPAADPDAETQALTVLPFPQQADGSRRSRATRRRVLFAVGGITLLGAGGATAYAVDGGGAPIRPRAAGSSASASRSASAASSSHPGVPGQTTAGSSATPGSPSPSGQPSTAGSPSSSSSLPPGTKVPTAPEWYVDDAGPMGIALTMDDGPDPAYTPQVLEVLARYKVKATFNMIGRQVGANLSLVREVSAAGHTVTNHTWDHADLTHYTLAQVLSEMDRCNDALADANQHPTIFRAPYGNWSKAVFQACARRELRPVGWSVDPRDWDTAHVDTQQIVQNVLHHTHPHSIILEHDGGGVRANTVAALKIFIPALLERGFHFVAM